MKPIFKSMIAIIAGLVFTVILSTLTDLALAKTGIMTIEPFDANPGWLIIMIILNRTLYNAVSCYLAARLAPNKPMKHAIILGIIELGLTIFGAVVMWHLPPRWYPVTIAMLTLPAAWSGGFLGTKQIGLLRMTMNTNAKDSFKQI